MPNAQLQSGQALLPFRPPPLLGYSTSSGSPSHVLLALYSNRGKAGVSPIIGTEGRLDGGQFHVVVCQLVISIIGTIRQRANLLHHVHDVLRPSGHLFLSASGVSDTINAGYARLYAEDLHLTGERHTYLSRDAGGEVLYATHHFAADELASLLEAAGFGEISVMTEKETSSRRPDEAAFFLYATCRSPR